MIKDDVLASVHDDLIGLSPMSKLGWQGRSHQIWSGPVSGAYVSTQQLAGSEGVPPRKFLEFRGYEVASETISGPKRCF